MCSSSVVELPFPKVANNFSHHVSKGTSKFLGGCEVMSGRGSVCKSILKAWVAFICFFLSWVSKTQPNHWTKRMVSTRLVT